MCKCKLGCMFQVLYIVCVYVVLLCLCLCICICAFLQATVRIFHPGVCMFECVSICIGVCV